MTDLWCSHRAAGNEVLFTDLIDLAQDKPTYRFEPPRSPDEDVRKTFITGIHTEGKLEEDSQAPTTELPEVRKGQQSTRT
jgi:hypothetical protein